MPATRLGTSFSIARTGHGGQHRHVRGRALSTRFAEGNGHRGPAALGCPADLRGVVVGKKPGRGFDADLSRGKDLAGQGGPAQVGVGTPAGGTPRLFLEGNPYDDARRPSRSSRYTAGARRAIDSPNIDDTAGRSAAGAHAICSEAGSRSSSTFRGLDASFPTRAFSSFTALPAPLHGVGSFRCAPTR